MPLYLGQDPIYFLDYFLRVVGETCGQLNEILQHSDVQRVINCMLKLLLLFDFAFFSLTHGNYIL